MSIGPCPATLQSGVRILFCFFLNEINTKKISNLGGTTNDPAWDFKWSAHTGDTGKLHNAYSGLVCMCVNSEGSLTACQSGAKRTLGNWTPVWPCMDGSRIVWDGCHPKCVCVYVFVGIFMCIWNVRFFYFF